MMDEGKPLRVSVVVATRNRSDSLGRLLEALERQVLPREQFEVIVVDDGSTDGTVERLAALRGRGGGRFTALRADESKGPAAARNLGIRAARGAVIAFTDDDCLPDPHWLEAGLGALENGAGVVMGRTRAHEHAPGYGARFSRTMEVAGEDGRYPTCNVFYLREALERAGGFDEVFRYACGEDTDLAWRVKALGYPSVFADQAVVVHEVRSPSFGLFLKERRRFADQILLVKRHPGVRTLFYRGYFYRRSHVHAIATLVLIATVLSGWRLAAVLLPIVWLDRFRHTPIGGSWTRRAVVAGEMLVGDVWELLVFSYWSLRYRTVLL